MFLSRKIAVLLAGGGIALLLLSSSPAAAQIAIPTPLSQVVATRQAAGNSSAQVGNLQAQRAQTEAKLAEINRNIEYQIAAAERAAADARVAAATQNAVEAGAAIGRLEGALAQLKDSYAGKDTLISEQTERLEQQAAQIDKLNMELQQTRADKQTVVNAYNAMIAQQETSQQNDMVGNAVKLIVVLAFLFAVLAVVLYRFSQPRRAVVIEPPPAEDNVIDAQIVNEDSEP